MSRKDEQRLREAFDMVKLAMWLLALQLPIIVVASILSPSGAIGWPL